MEWLEIYGKPIFQYHGSGTISEANGNKQLEVIFDLAQLANGQIFCEISSESEALDEAYRKFGDCVLHGLTEYGYEITVTRLSFLSHHMSRIPRASAIRAIVFDDVTIKTPNTCLHGDTFPTRFLVTNFHFFSHWGSSEDYSWSIKEHTIALRPLPNHKEESKRIRASKTSGITATITVEPTHGLEGLVDSENWATRLCWLLSLAQGCHVNWCCYESMLDRHLVVRHHRSIPLLSPTGRQLIPSDDKNFHRYITECLPVYVAKEQTWRLPLLIDMFVRAVMTQPFPEPPALHLAVLMDYMSGLYRTIEGKEQLVDAETFRNAKKELKKGFNEVIKAVLPDLNSETRGTMLRHIGILQFRPFSDSLKGMAKHLGLALEDGVVDQFKSERDNLAHRYSFSVERDPLTILDDMISFVSKFMLAILEYKGFFYDWAIPPSDYWENRKVKLPLSSSV